MMPLIYALGGLLLNLATPLVSRVLLALGLSYVTYTGFDTAITWLLNQVKANMSALPADVLSFLAWLWVDKAIGVMFSAYAACMAVKLAGSTTLTRLVRK